MFLRTAVRKVETESVDHIRPVGVGDREHIRRTAHGGRRIHRKHRQNADRECDRQMRR
jgi:hypothetical protein